MALCECEGTFSEAMAVGRSTRFGRLVPECIKICILMQVYEFIY